MKSPQVFIKKECTFLENFNNKSQLDKLKIQEKLLKSQKECEDLREKLTMSMENENMSKRAQERYAKFCEEQLQITNEKDEIISELNAKVTSLNYQVLETEQVINDLRNKIVFLELDKKRSEQTIEKLERKNLEALQTIEEFENLVGSVNGVFEEHNKILGLLPRMNKVEQGLVKVLKVKVHDLGKSFGVNSPISKGCRDVLPLSTRINKGGGNGDGSPDQAVLEIHNCSHRVEANSTDLEKGRTETSAGNSAGIFVAEDAVEVTNHDDETRPGESKYNPKRKRSSLGNRYGNLPNKRQKEEHTQEPGQENDESLGIKSSTLNSVLRRCMEKAVAASNSQTQLSTSSSESEDESYSDSYMNNMVRIFRFENLRKTWKYESDMLKDFKKDVELCMDAVCVLYRWKRRKFESLACSGVDVLHFDAMGGSELAEYLINGDPDRRLRKFVSDVEKERPDGLIQQCRNTATVYCGRLFSIYCNGKDSFFKS